eukprot:TRINITY_DN2090_c0_g1_i3.p1 TRINITY_DN2090_c0_g1~~TRINITY_DN2090_c0_g1_i3.p1  ORF type:complete len:219 (+),score=34.39 TRINITY_DN2090_c0_g1_i3:236-892(+)
MLEPTVKALRASREDPDLECLLIQDNCSAHNSPQALEFCKETCSTFVQFLPANMTNYCQDQVGKAFRQSIYALLDVHLEKLSADGVTKLPLIDKRKLVIECTQQALEAWRSDPTKADFVRRSALRTGLRMRVGANEDLKPVRFPDSFGASLSPGHALYHDHDFAVPEGNVQEENEEEVTAGDGWSDEEDRVVGEHEIMSEGESGDEESQEGWGENNLF